MANTNAPFGFRQYSGTGSAPTYEQVAMRILYSNTTPLICAASERRFPISR